MRPYSLANVPRLAGFLVQNISSSSSSSSRAARHLEAWGRSRAAEAPGSGGTGTTTLAAPYAANAARQRTRRRCPA